MLLYISTNFIHVYCTERLSSFRRQKLKECFCHEIIRLSNFLKHPFIDEDSHTYCCLHTSRSYHPVPMLYFTMARRSSVWLACTSQHDTSIYEDSGTSVILSFNNNLSTVAVFSDIAIPLIPHDNLVCYMTY